VNKKPIFRLIGELKKNGGDWDNSSFGRLFQRLENEVSKPSQIFRYIRLDGYKGKSRDLRFFGIGTDGFDTIPNGMVCLELSGHSLVLSESPPNESSEYRFEWDWLDTSEPDYPLVEGNVRMTDSQQQEILRLVVSGFARREKDRRADDSVEIVTYDPSWPDRFEETKAWLKRILPSDFTRRIEHYGSTAIPGMPAKPVIDILLAIPSFEEARPVLLPLFNKPEYEYWWYNNHMTIIVRDGFLGKRIHHIHAAPEGHQVWEGIRFRDHLITHPVDAARYKELKYSLAQSQTEDRERYTELKYEFVREITDKTRTQDET
jgi:GrpB-like predicted nucleotidyltransferase (UPF0157 family)